MGNKLTIMPGDRFGRLTIVREIDPCQRKRRFLCECDCGNQKIVYLLKLRSGNTRSCGCYQSESRGTSTRTHGDSNTRLYSIWCDMKARCTNPQSTSYKDYGGRGIKVCSEWAEYQAFKAWAMENGYDDSLSIERVENNGDYRPENCKWIPFCKQVNNTRKTIAICYNGRTQNLKQWAEELGIRYLLLYKRIVTLGWSVEKAFETPVRPRP